MNEPTSQNTKQGNTKSADQIRKSRPNDDDPRYQQSGRAPDSEEADQEGVDQDTPGEDDEDEDVNPPNKKDTENARPRAAKGNDDVMSQQQNQSMPSADGIKGAWKQQVGAAKIVWGKLTDDELLKSEGHAQKLAGLVQERYAVTRDEAEKQVKTFIEKNKLN